MEKMEEDESALHHHHGVLHTRNMEVFSNYELLLPKFSVLKLDGGDGLNVLAEAADKIIEDSPPFPEQLFPLPTTGVLHQPKYLCRIEIGSSSSKLGLVLPPNAKSWFLLFIDRDKLATQGYDIYLRTRRLSETKIRLKLLAGKLRLQSPWGLVMRQNEYTWNTEVDIWGYNDTRTHRAYLVMHQLNGRGPGDDALQVLAAAAVKVVGNGGDDL